MCLLFVKPANVTLTAEQVADFFSRNKDGYGVMYAEDGKLHTEKALGNCDDWVEFFLRLQAKKIDMAFHLRMQTHGDIDLTNCHPYPVFGFEGEATSMPVAMMHNGVLSTGNAKDKTKSDTWHYIRDIIRDLTMGRGEGIFTDAFAKVIGNHIGTNNKFCFMNHLGEIQIINKSSGVEWNGIWFSNTYAWSAFDNELFPGRGSRTTLGYGAYHGYGSKLDDDDFYLPGRRGSRSLGGTVVHHLPKNQEAKVPETPVINETTSMFNEADVQQAQLDFYKAQEKAERRAKAVLDFRRKVSEKKGKKRRAEKEVPPLLVETPHVVLDSDVTYVMETVHGEPAFEAVSPEVTAADVENLLATFGPTPMFELIERVLMGELKCQTFLHFLGHHNAAKSYFSFQSRRAGTPDDVTDVVLLND
jgi:hypothetical protein